MTKQDFMEKLRLALTGKVSGSVVTENLQYYEDYINTEIRKGKSEEEVLATLGDPRLIARTIITASTQAEAAGSGEYREYGRSERYQGNERRMPVWLWLVLGMLIIVLVFSAVVSLLSFLWPILLPVIIIMVVTGVVKFFRDWMN